MAGILLAFTPYLLALHGLALNASIGRPIWYDEFLQFALAAEPSTGEAWRVAARTFLNINHGQTGVYMMLNYWTLSLTGPDAIALRLPSLLSGAFLLGSTIFLFRALGFSVAWQLVAVAALIGQHMLMYFAGEARPYMPLAAAAVGILAYYVGRARWSGGRAVLVLGVVAAFWGTLMHPYFAVYWPAACIIGWLYRCTLTGEGFNLRTLIAFCNPPLVLAGATLFFLVGMATWLRGGPTFAFDPFYWTRQAGLWVTFTDYSHAQFLAGSGAAAAGFTLVSILGLFLLPAPLRNGFGRVWAPILLIVLALGISVLVSWFSYRVNYWILGRQWVASIALVAIGTIWLWAEAANVWGRVAPVLGMASVIIAAAIVYGQVINIHNVRVAEIRAALARSRSAEAAFDCTPPTDLRVADMSNDERNRLMVDLANRDIGCGEPVWPAFRDFYPAAMADYPALLADLARLRAPK